MMTFRAGSVAGATVSNAISEYYLSGTVQSESVRAAQYYAGREERADSFWHSEVIDGRLEMRQHRAELREGLSAEMAAKLGLNGQPLTQERVANLLSLKRADGERIEGRQIHRSRGGRKPPVGFIDLTFSSSKSLSVAWGLAANQEERNRLVGIHREAVRKTMGYVSQEIGYTRRGGKKNTRPEPGEIAWIGFQHYTSRPVAGQAADPNLHTHIILLNHVMTDSGHMGAIDRNRLGGRVKEFGAVFEAHVATAARALGAKVHFDERRESAELSDIPEHVNHLFSKRSQQTRTKAEEIAREDGIDWDTLIEERQARLRERAALESREAKTGEKNDFASWSEQADEAGYRYQSVLGRVEAATLIADPEPIDDFSRDLLQAITAALSYADPKDQADRLLWEMDDVVRDHRGEAPSTLAKGLLKAVTESLSSPDPERVLIAAVGDAIRGQTEREQAAKEQDEQRVGAAYQSALPRLSEEFRRRSVLEENELRRVSAQSFISHGIKDAGRDLDMVMRAFRRDGVVHQGQRVSLVEQDAVTVRGTPRVRMTTQLHVAQEQELIRLARAAAEDVSAALPARKIDAATSSFLDRHPEIDRYGAHWKAQRGMIDHLATGGRLGVVIGVPGSGKSYGLAPMVEAWRNDGRTVYGISLAWRQATDLRDAGIEERASIAAFLKRVETGRYALDRNSVVVVDEVGLVGSRQMLDLLRVQESTGAQIVMIGDPRQNQPIEGSSGLELLRTALGEAAIPRLLYSVRQDSQRERDIAALFRRGQASEAIEMKREDGTAILVGGGRDATIARIAQLWRERIEAHRDDEGFTLTISTPTNADARDIGTAIRDERRKMGELGKDVETVRAVDRTGNAYDLPLALGDRVRLFDRVYDPETRRILGNNGDVVEVRRLQPDGMIIRNGELEGLVPWNKIRSGPDEPVRLAHGYALTVDAAQGSTASEHIYALPSGSQSTHGFKTYTASTRHRQMNWMVVDDESERAQILDLSMLGHKIEITEQDVWQNVAKNVAQQPQKPLAISVVQTRQQQQVAA